MLARQAVFRRAADVIAADLATFPEVRAITLFGSVARMLEREVPRFQPFRRLGIEILHECGDIDLAIQIDRLDDLTALNRGRSQAVVNLYKESGIGLAHHQVDIFLFGEGWKDYRGRLRTYAQCPKGKDDCLTPGCGSKLFLKQHQRFVLKPDALAAERTVRLYERGHVLLRRDSDCDKVMHILPKPPSGVVTAK